MIPECSIRDHPASHNTSPGILLKTKLSLKGTGLVQSNERHAYSGRRERRLVLDLSGLADGGLCRYDDVRQKRPSIPTDRTFCGEARAFLLDSSRALDKPHRAARMGCKPATGTAEQGRPAVMTVSASLSGAFSSFPGP